MDVTLLLLGALFLLGLGYLLVLLRADAQERRFKELRQREGAMAGLERISQYTKTKA